MNEEVVNHHILNSEFEDVASNDDRNARIHYDELRENRI